jgi:hypothetical protein
MGKEKRLYDDTLLNFLIPSDESLEVYDVCHDGGCCLRTLTMTREIYNI